MSVHDQRFVNGQEITPLVLALGPTGVEFAAELYDFLNEDLVGYVRDLTIFLSSKWDNIADRQLIHSCLFLLNTILVRH